MTIRKDLERMARQAKKKGWSREKAARLAPPKDTLHHIFMTEFDRYQPRRSK